MSLIRKRWERSTRWLWCIFALVRARVSPQSPKKGDGIHRDVEYLPAKTRSTVICASRFPLPSSSISGGDTPVTSPTPIPTQVRQAGDLNPEDPFYGTHENHSDENLGVGSHLLEESRPISRSPESASRHHERELIHVVIPPRRGGHTPPDIPSLPLPQHSRAAPQISVCSPPSLYPPSQYSHQYPPPPQPMAGPVTSHLDYDLRPMAAINRYEKQKEVVVNPVTNSHYYPAVTTRFLRWVSSPGCGTQCI